MRGAGHAQKGPQKGGYDSDELDDAESGLRVLGSLMYTEEGEAKEHKAFKKAQAAKAAQGADKPVWQQEVLDSEGRKRLHGAFTGGYSAGYFNTVGSKEGWTPSTFVSSRSNRAKIAAQRTEDFMDAEDIAERDTGGKQLETTDEFAGLGPGKATAVPDSLLVPAELLEPATDPVGLRLLRLMGWRDGQGVGPRRKRVHEKVGQGDGDGGRGDGDEGEHDALLREFKFAPKDVEIFEATVKDDLFGLGFDPLANTPEFAGLLRNTSSAMAQAQRKQLLSSRLAFGGSKSDGGDGGAFGLGIDDEPDALDSQTGDRKQDYDTEMVDEEDEEHLMQMVRQPKKKPDKKAAVAAGAKDKGGGEVPWAGGGRKVCSDGRRPLASFVLASEVVQPKKIFPPPKVPEDFVPLHRFNDVLNVSAAAAPADARAAPAPKQIADLDASQLLALAQGKPVALLQRPGGGAGGSEGKRGVLTAKDRSELLGETRCRKRALPRAS